MLLPTLVIIACTAEPGTEADSTARGDDSGAPDGVGDSTPPPPRWVDIEAASAASCALDSAGEVACWGDPSVGEPPPGPFVAIGVSLGRACGLRDDGAVRCWGMGDPYGGLTPPTGVYARFALGDELACAIAADGTYACWGRTDGLVIPERTDAVTVDVGNNGLCELDAAGTITCVGWINGSAAADAQVPPADTYTALGVGEGLACAVRAADGAVVCWGARVPPSGAEPAGGGYRSVYAGLAGACALDAAGALACEGTVTPYRDPLSLTGPLVDVAAGSEHVCGLREDGTIECQGEDDVGQSTPPGPPTAR